MRWAAALLTIGFTLGLATAGGCGRNPTPSGRSAAPAPAAAPEPSVAAEAKELAVYSWPDYMAPGIIERFEQETGIKVTYKTYDSDEELETLLLMKVHSIDVAMPSAPYFERQVRAGEYLPLDKSALTNYGNLDREVLSYLAEYDPGNRYAVPFMRSTVGLLYDVVKIHARLGSDIPESWALLFDPAVVSRLQDCGVGFADLPVETVAAILQYEGQDPKQMGPRQVAQAGRVLRQIRPAVSAADNAFNLHADDLSSGNFCLALTWGGDAVLARARAKERRQPLDLRFVVPAEGGFRWLDMNAIPSNAPHPRNALLWLNYLMRPEVIAELSNYLKYANGNAAAAPLLDAALTSDRTVYPDALTQHRLINAVSTSAELSLVVKHEWMRFRTNGKSEAPR